jgi:hypothetical protein
MLSRYVRAVQLHRREITSNEARHDPAFVAAALTGDTAKQATHLLPSGNGQLAMDRRDSTPQNDLYVIWPRHLKKKSEPGKGVGSIAPRSLCKEKINFRKL